MPEDPPDDKPLHDPDLPQIYVLKLFSQRLPGKITLIEVRIDTEVLSKSLREDALFIIRGGPEHHTEKDMIEACGVETWAQVREQVLADASFENAAEGMKQFLLQHFPKLLRKTYDVTSLAAVVSLLEDLVFTKAADRDEREQLVKRVLKAAVKELQGEIKQMLKTRPVGRPSRIVTEDVPPIVRTVMRIARQMMGNDISASALPSLKSIADKLDLTENALGKQLRTAGYSWTTLKRDLLVFPSADNSN